MLNNKRERRFHFFFGGAMSNEHQQNNNNIVCLPYSKRSLITEQFVRLEQRNTCTITHMYLFIAISIAFFHDKDERKNTEFDKKLRLLERKQRE